MGGEPSLGDFLRRLVEFLDHAGIPRMVAGSVASSAHGQPRSTQDIDLVVDPTRDELLAFLGAMPEDQMYVSEAAALQALQARRQFNVIDLRTGWKADLIIRKERPFSIAEFGRRRPTTLLGVTVDIASVEDVILAKLEWAKRGGGSARQLRDVCGMLAAQPHLDGAYLHRWSVPLGVEDLLATARQQVVDLER